MFNLRAGYRDGIEAHYVQIGVNMYDKGYFQEKPLIKIQTGFLSVCFSYGRTSCFPCTVGTALGVVKYGWLVTLFRIELMSAEPSIPWTPRRR